MKTSKILLYDIETSYIIGGTWGIWQTDVCTVLADWQILCFAYKWLGDKKVTVVAQDDFSNYKGVNDDTNVVKELHKLFDMADIVIAHNGNSFDQKKSQARFMVRGLPPPSPYKQIDTKLAIKRVGAHTSNKLNDLNRSLGLQLKIDTGGIDTWTGCMNGDPRAWKKMKKYNKHDIIALEELYLVERPWITNHPALNVIENRPDACPKCGAEDWQSKGRYNSQTTTYQRFACNNCGGYAKLRLGDRQIEKPKYASI